jgi:hypothetical protein
MKKLSAKGISFKLNRECPMKLGISSKKVINQKAICSFLCDLMSL